MHNEKRGLWRRGLVASLAVSMAAVAAGCGANTGAPANTGSSSPHYGGTFTMAYQSDVPTLDPVNGGGFESAQAMYGLYNTLVTYAPTSMKLVPSLASSWKVSSNGLVYTFTLRSGVRYSNGDHFKPQDVIFNLERQVNPKNASWAQAYYLDIAGAQQYANGKASSISGLKVTGPHTLQITLVQPEGYFLNILAMPTSDIADPAVVQQYGASYEDHAVGTGPYMLTQWTHNQVLIEKRNPYYWGPKPYFSELKFLLGPSPQTQFLMFERGQVDAMGPVPSSDMVPVLNSPTLKKDLVTSANTGSVEFYFMKVTYGPFKKTAVRQALNLAVNRKRLVQLSAGQAIPANQYIPPGYPGYQPNLPQIPYNPTKAKQLLASAGYPHGFTVTLTVNNDPSVIQRAQSVIANLAAIGVTVHLQTMSLSAYDTALSENKVNFGVIDWGMDYPDPQDIMASTLAGFSDGQGNLSWWNDPQFNHLLNIADSMPPSQDAQRYKLYDQAQAIALQQQPWIPLIFPTSTVLVSPKLAPAPTGANQALYLSSVQPIEINDIWQK